MKKYILTSIPFILAIGCIVVFNIIGSRVAPDGALIEPFFLIPMAYLFLAIGIISLLIKLMSFFYKYKKSYK